MKNSTEKLSTLQKLKLGFISVYIWIFFIFSFFCIWMIMISEFLIMILEIFMGVKPNTELAFYISDQLTNLSTSHTKDILDVEYRIIFK